MPKSKTNKERKANLNNFKNQQKSKFMSENQKQMPQITPFRQIPIWNQDSEFTISGSEFMVLQNFFHIFAEPIAVMQEIFKRGLNSGTIQTKYVDEKGDEISKEQIEGYMKQMQEFFQNTAVTPTDEKNETPKVKEPAIKKARSVGKTVKAD